MGRSLPPHELARLAAAATGRGRASLLAVPVAAGEEQARLDALVERRLAGEPLQYLEGRLPFGPIEVRVDHRALIPRPETEQLWELAVALLGRAGPGTPLVDVGTGSGVLALALKHAFPTAPVYGIDVSAEAVALARRTARPPVSRSTFLEGDLLEPLPAALRGRVELIVSNPPYVSEAEWAALPDEIRLHEPRAGAGGRAGRDGGAGPPRRRGLLVAGSGGVADL